MKRSFLLFGPPHIQIFRFRPYHGLRSGVYGGESRDCGEAAPGVPCVTPSSFHAGKKRALIANRGRRASARSGIMESSTKHPTPFLHAGINRRAAGSARASATIYPKGGPHGGPVAHLGWACRATGSAQGGRRRAVGMVAYGEGSPAAWTPSGVVLLLVFLVILRAPVEQGPRERPPSALVGFREQLPRQISRQRLPVPDVRRGTQSNA